MPFKRTKSNANRKKKDLGVYKSGLEAYCGKRLKEEGIDFGYESESFTVQEGFTPTNKYYKSVPKDRYLVEASGKKVLPITYKPDFVSHTNRFIIETKGFVRANDSFPVRWKMFMKFLHDNHMDYQLFIPKNKDQVDSVINIIKDGIKQTK
jgi:hypothetical protein